MRRRETIKHPALAAKQNSEPKVWGLPGWEKLTWQHQRFLSAMAWEHDVDAACAKAGVSRQWVEEERLLNAEFRQLALVGAEQGKEVAQRMLAEMLPWSLVELRRVIEQERDLRSKVAAIRHLHEIAGLAPPATGLPMGNYLNVQVSLFGQTEQRREIIIGENKKDHG